MDWSSRSRRAGYDVPWSLRCKFKNGQEIHRMPSNKPKEILDQIFEHNPQYDARDVEDTNEDSKFSDSGPGLLGSFTDNVTAVESHAGFAKRQETSLQRPVSGYRPMLYSTKDYIARDILRQRRWSGFCRCEPQ